MKQIDSSSETSNPSPTLTSSTTGSGKEQRISAGNKSSYYMALAFCVQARGKCHRQVGCVIVRDERIIATGYNGTPFGIDNCPGKDGEGPCARCREKENFKNNFTRGYDSCICVHAEQNALMSCARFGISVENSTLYSTLQPCFTCFKLLMQAGIKHVVYCHSMEYNEDLSAMYEVLKNGFGDLNVTKISPHIFADIILKNLENFSACLEMEKKEKDTEKKRSEEQQKKFDTKLAEMAKKNQGEVGQEQPLMQG